MGKPCTGTAKANWINGEKVRTSVGRSVNLRLLLCGRHPETRKPLPPAIPEAHWHTVGRIGRQSNRDNTYRYQPAAGLLARKRLKASSESQRMPLRRRPERSKKLSRSLRSTFNVDVAIQNPFSSHFGPVKMALGA